MRMPLAEKITQAAACSVLQVKASRNESISLWMLIRSQDVQLSQHLVDDCVEATPV